MALKSTIFKATLAVSDMDRHYYEQHALTVARHPSETDERMMLRIAAFALYASDSLSFGRGISTDDEPDLWQKNAVGDIEHWIDLGLPSLERLRKACSRAKKVTLWAYGSDQAFAPWWKKIAASLKRFKHLTVIRVAPESSANVTAMIANPMQLQAMIQDAELYLSDEQVNTCVQLQLLEDEA